LEEKKSFFCSFTYQNVAVALLCWLNFFFLFYFSFRFEEEIKERNILEKGGKKSNFFGVLSSCSFR